LIPIFFGFDSVIYNRDVVRDVDVDTWGLIFDERFAGKIGWYDVAHQMFLAGGLFLGHKEPERMDRNDLAEVTKFLISKKKLVRTTYRTFSECVNLMASGEIVVSYAAVPIRSELQQKGYNVTNGWPKEGVLSFSQNAYIPKDFEKVGYRAQRYKHDAGKGICEQPDQGIWLHGVLDLGDCGN